jgi:anti-anti-sigma factor
MNITATLPLEDSLDASAPGCAKPFNRLLAVDDHTSTRGRGATPLGASGAALGAVRDAPRVLTVAGYDELTAATCKVFRKQVCAALNGHTEVEIDLSQTTAIDCAGFGALIAIRNLTRGRNAVRLINPTSQVQQLLDLMRAGQIFEIVKTTAD